MKVHFPESTNADRGEHQEHRGQDEDDAQEGHQDHPLHRHVLQHVVQSVPSIHS